MKLLYVLLVTLIFAGCNSQHFQDNKQHQVTHLVYDLNVSTQIIIELLKKEELSQLLADAPSQDTIDTLIKNFSPSEIAFEVEVLNYENPAVILFFNAEDQDAKIIDKNFQELAHQFQQKAKFVTIDVVKFFKLTEQAFVEETPTILVIHKREEIGRWEKPKLSLLKAELLALLK